MWANAERTRKQEMDLPSQPRSRSGCGRIKTLASGARKFLDAPRSFGNWYKKVVLWPLIVLIGFPLYFVAFCLALLPFLTAGALLFLQMDLFQQHKHWYSLSLLDVATQTVDPKLSDPIGAPALSACQGLRKGFAPAPAQKKGLKEQPCPQLDAWQRWLIAPGSRLDLRQLLVPVLNLISVSMMLFLMGLFTWNFFLHLRRIWQPEAPKPEPKRFEHIRHYPVVLRH